MTGTLFNAPRYIPVNNAGIPRGGAKLYFYQAGTATPATVYQTSALSGGASHTSPVVASSSGEFAAIYLDPTAGYDYKAVLLSSADVQIWAEDDIPAGPSAEAIGAALYPRTTAEIAAAVTPTNYQYEPGNVLRYGADSTGATSSTTAVQAAISQAAVNADTTDYAGTRVYFPAGTYLVTDGALTYGSNATGLLFYGDGPTSSTIKLATNGTNQVYLYNNTGAQSYRNTFRDLRFLGADQAYCNGFKLNDSAGWEKQFKFDNCRFQSINTVLTTTGTTNADECTFTNCEWNPVTTLLNVSNSQSMLHHFIGCRGVINGDVWVIGASGGGEFHYTGGSIIHAPSSSDKFWVNGSAGPATSVQTGNFTFSKVRSEHRGQYAKLINWPVSDSANRSRQVQITFDNCNLATSNQGSGTTRNDFVLIGEGKSVTFRDCTLPIAATGTYDDYEFTITADDGGAPPVPNAGIVVFDGCVVQKALASKCTVTNRYGVFSAINCVSNEITTTSLSTHREVVNFSKGMAESVGGTCVAPVKTLFLKRYVWPYSNGDSTFSYEYTATLPAGTILLRATIYKPATGADTDTCQYHIGTDDKGTSYVTTGSAAQNALHAATAQLNLAPLATDTGIRLWLSETTPNTCTGQMAGGYAFVEYI